MNKRFIVDVSLALALLLVGMYFRDDIQASFRLGYDRLYPCSTPIQYSIHDFSTKFGISKSDFQLEIQKAISIWEKPLGRQLFQYVPEDEVRTAATSTSIWSRIKGFRHTSNISDPLEINLIYDERQKVTFTLQDIKTSLKVDKNTYAEQNVIYARLTAEYKKQKLIYDTLAAQYKSESGKYSQRVREVNAKGGASPDEYTELKQIGITLEKKFVSIKEMENELSKLASEINTTAATLNMMARELNLKVETYNDITFATGREFEEGEYVVDDDGRRINVYQFDNREKLIRVLAHELGHALGLQHIDNPKAIMYRLNEGENMKLTNDDLNALKDLCSIEKKSGKI